MTAHRPRPTNHGHSLAHATAATGCTRQPQWPWAVIETLTSTSQPTVVVDGARARSFTRLNNASIGKYGAAALLLPALTERCTDSGTTHDKLYTLPDGQLMRMVGIPVPGPSGAVHAVAVWAGAHDDRLPMPPTVGAFEWTADGIATGTPAAHYLMQLPYGDLPNVHTIPQLLTEFDHWDNRMGFLAMFNLEAPAASWTGTATKIFKDGTQHHLHIAARATGVGAARTVRAIVCDITTNRSTIAPDACTLLARNLPIPHDHAFGLVDLKTGFIHEWLANERSPLAGWRHHNPTFDDDGRLLIATTIYKLAKGLQRHVGTTANIRFDSDDEWIRVHARWTRISDGDQPQALIDVTPLSQIPPRAVHKCGICQDMASSTNDLGAEAM